MIYYLYSSVNVIRSSVIQKGVKNMADGKELKPKSFRINDETADKFKKISTDIGGNQQETLAKLIESYEFQAGKAILTDKKDDIEQFERYVKAITRMFMGALEDNQNVTEIVRTEFEAQLKSKDTIIQDLQAQIKVAKQLRQESDEKARLVSGQNEEITKKFEKLLSETDAKISDLNSMIADKDKLNQALNNNLADLQQKIDEMKSEHNNYAAVCQERDKLQSEVSVLEKEKNAAESQIESNREKAALEQEKALLDLEKEHQSEIEKIKMDCRTQIDEYQKKYFELLEKMQNNDGNK